jgi:cell shape-determining protein MreC
MAKYLLILAVVISLITAGLGFVNRNKLIETRDTLATTETSLQSTRSELAKTKGVLDDTDKKLVAKTTEQEKTAADLASTQSDLDATKKQLSDANASITAKDTEIQTLTADNTKLKSDLTIAMGGTSDTAPEDPRIKELEAQNASLNDRVKDIDAQLATYKKKEKDRQDKIVRKGLEGQVLAVNPAWNFVVLSIGDRQGIVNNAELLLKRGGQYLGKVRITSVEPSTSIADIVANTLPAGVSVRPGDRVIFQGSEE